MIGRKAEAVLNRAVRYAVEQEHEYFTLEHVFWSLLADSKISEAVIACGGNPDHLRLELERYLQTEVPKVSRSEEASSESQSDSNALRGDEDEALDHPVATLGIQRLIQRALFHVQSAGKEEIQPEDLFVALFQAKDSKALLLLVEQGIERLEVLHYLSHGADKEGVEKEEFEEDLDDSLGDDPEFSMGNSAHSSRGTSRESSRSGAGGHASQRRAHRGAPSHEDTLSLYASNLNELAKQGRIDPLIGRSAEIERMIQVFCRRRKNNPLLVGEAGVGKTALAEGLACRIVEKAVPDLLQNGIIYSLDLGSLLAGAKFRGDFEQRFKKVIQALESRKDKGQDVILFIDEIHTLIGAGAVSGGALDAAHLLKPLLAQGRIRCMGSTTYAEYRSIFEKEHALARRFQKIEVNEPSVEEAVEILAGLKSRFEQHHCVYYSPDAIRAAVELSAQHVSDRFLPDKAIDVMDEVGARARLQAYKTAQQDAVGGLPLLETAHVEEVVAQMARIPPRSVSVDHKLRLKNLDSDLKLSIFGQDPAVKALVTSIRLARSGLHAGDRPLGSFLFCGPTGVGKTELSKQLAHCLGVPFVRFDMSEYSEKHSISRLIGAPPGYVGFEQAGLLTEAVTKNPHSVLLLDEIEKAHYDIWNVLLQVMDHGALTDHNGRKADFRNSIIIMTSNVGSREMERRSLGIMEESQSQAQAQKAVEQTFSPEFRNRLDAIVFFNPLDRTTLLQVVQKQLMQLESQLLAKKVDIEFDASVIQWLAKKGYDRRMGARPLGRVIQDAIKRPLSEEILFGKLENGGKVRVTVGEQSQTDLAGEEVSPLEFLYRSCSSSLSTSLPENLPEKLAADVGSSDPALEGHC